MNYTSTYYYKKTIRTTSADGKVTEEVVEESSGPEAKAKAEETQNKGEEALKKAESEMSKMTTRMDNFFTKMNEAFKELWK